MSDETVSYGSVTPDASAPPALEGQEPEEAPSRGLLVPLLIGGLVLSTVLAVTFLVFLLQSSTDPEDVAAFLADEKPAIEDVSRELVLALSNYDAATLDGQREKILDLSTGHFLQQYEDTIAQGLNELLAEAGATSKGQIIEGPDVSFETADRAIAIVRMAQTTQTTDDPGGRTFTYVMQIILIDTSDGGWKADDVEVLSQQST